jgi:hypothetical protein
MNPFLPRKYPLSHQGRKGEKKEEDRKKKRKKKGIGSKTRRLEEGGCRNTPTRSHTCYPLPQAFLEPGASNFTSTGDVECQVHPTSMMSQAGTKWDHGYIVMAFFERLQTSQLFLRDCTLVNDSLPLFLLLPNLVADEMARDGEGAVDKSIFKVASTGHSPLLIKTADDKVGELLARLR